MSRAAGSGGLGFGVRQGLNAHREVSLTKNTAVRLCSRRLHCLLALSAGSRLLHARPFRSVAFVEELRPAGPVALHYRCGYYARVGINICRC
jgi:hypothetical protein